jgi:large subunit GTPase 1
MLNQPHLPHSFTTTNILDYHSAEVYIAQELVTEDDDLSSAKMVLAKSKNAVGLGNRYVQREALLVRILTIRSLMNDRFGKGKGADRKKVTSAGIQRVNHATGETVSSASTAGCAKR